MKMKLAVVLSGAALLGAIAFVSVGAIADSPADGDEIVGINPAPAGGPFYITVRPDGWQQPAFGLLVTEGCRNTLNLGDPWPSLDPACQ